VKGLVIRSKCPRQCRLSEHFSGETFNIYDCSAMQRASLRVAKVQQPYARRLINLRQLGKIRPLLDSFFDATSNLASHSSTDQLIPCQPVTQPKVRSTALAGCVHHFSPSGALLRLLPWLIAGAFFWSVPMRTKSLGGPARESVANGFVKGRKPICRPRNPMVAALVVRKTSSAGGRHLQSKSAMRIALSKTCLMNWWPHSWTTAATAVESKDHDGIQ